jgi:xylulokinase
LEKHFDAEGYAIEHQRKRREGVMPDKTSEKKRYVLAIDLGSGGHKVAVVADNGDVITSADETITTHMLPDGGAEQDPQEWWDKAKSLSKKVIKESNVQPEDIVAVACDSQWSLAVPVDENGDHLMRAVHWLDTRGGKYNREITAGFPNILGYGLFKLLKWIKYTGLAPTHSGADSLGHILYIKNEQPDIYSKTYKFLEPMDYLTSRLTGRITATQKTMAPFIVADNRQWGSQEYSEPLLKLAGVEKEKFPEMIPNDGVIGPLQPAVAEELGLNPSTQVIAGIGDSNASLIGSGAVNDFESIIYIGTSLYMTCHIPFKKTDIFHMMTSLPSPFTSRYYLLGEQGTGGRCIEVYLKNIIYPDDEFKTGPKPDDAYERFNEMAKRAPAGSEGILFLPWLNGSFVPAEEPNMRGGFMNLSLKTERSHLTRAIMEGLAYNNRWTMEAAEKFIGRSIQHFRFSGGGALSDVWSQIHADVLGVPIHQIEDPVNATVRGAAMLALITLGYRSVEDISSFVTIKKVFEPDTSNRGIYDKMYTQYREIFKRNKKVFNALNG